ncbi:zinc-binding dehydrogenase [Novosphingobium sp. FGD1]|uniref:Zinc-binding dehydrogenase n=1 Tax=Novosphingobium silvae TaxID=2692619 RepID=A0A7X4K8G3_9SPHN|nr:NADP-dependent oxidoreductase [Novosphingobium silvae]MYM00147.1 zinc-binding dehydrogenase [Novosphingobium silvae]
MQNRRVILSARPAGVAQAEHLSIDTATVKPPQDREILVRNHALSVDPVMRWWLSDGGGVSTPIGIGEVVRSLAVGEIVASNCEGFKPGEMVLGWFGWQEYAAVGAESVIRKVQENGLAPSLSLGVLGINGITAYLALTQVARPKPGETVLVTAAAGAVGSAAGQIARNLGCRTIGIAGSDAKVAACLDHYGYDAAVSYRSENLTQALQRHSGAGIDIFFDNVAGPVSDLVMNLLAERARIIVSGTIGVSDWSSKPEGPRHDRVLLSKRARWEGFVVFDHMDKYDLAVAQLAQWIRDGSLRYREDVLDGIEKAPDALAGLYRGENEGKRIVKLI